MTAIIEVNLEPLQEHSIYSLLDTIPNTRYYGSKKRLLPWIYDEIKDYDFTTVLDAFGGTASVSLLFQFMGKNVHFNDAMKCNCISAEVLLNGSYDSLIYKEVNEFFNSVKPDHMGTVSKHYKDIFFTDDENAWLDGVLQKIFNLKEKNKKNLYLYLVMQASLMKRPFNLFHRANLNLRTAKNINRNFGNMTTWERSFPETIDKIMIDLLRLSERKNKAKINEPLTAEKLPVGYDLVYLDPPYVKKEVKDTYWKKYHFLEGLVNYPNMHLLIENNLKIKQLRKNKYMDEWEKPTLFKDRLFSLIEKHKNSIVALSYMTDAVPHENELLNFFKKQFKSVKLSRKDFSHALAKKKKTEILIVGIP